RARGAGARVAGDAIRQVVSRGRVAGTNAVDVERAQSFLVEIGGLRSQRRLLDVVFSLQEVDRIDLARGDLLSNGGNRESRHGLGSPEGLRYGIGFASADGSGFAGADGRGFGSAGVQACSKSLQNRAHDRPCEVGAHALERARILLKKCHRIDETARSGRPDARRLVILPAQDAGLLTE